LAEVNFTQPIKHVLIIVLALSLMMGCSKTDSTGPDDQLFAEYDDGLNLTVEHKSPGPQGSGENRCTTVGFIMPRAGAYMLSILNCTGYRVKTYGGYKEAGAHEVKWDWSNEGGVEVKDGIYIFELYAGGYGARRATIVER
jgi:hypothetical protein